MIYTIQNECLTAQINSLGAELISVVDTAANQYIFQPSPIWPGQAKNLFPNVALAKGDYTIIRGKRYPMHQHGFAKEMTFAVADQGADHISFALASNEETAKFIPYQFTLYIRFALQGNHICQTYDVVNQDAEEMFFGIACHTGFATAPDSYVDFMGNANLQEVCRKDMKYLTGEIIPYPLEGGKLPVTPKYYGDGAHILQGFTNKKLHLVNPSLGTSVTIGFDGFDYMTLWSTPDAETVLCMMPWCALPDAEDTTHIFEEKQGNQRLAAGETFHVCQDFAFATLQQTGE